MCLGVDWGGSAPCSRSLWGPDVGWAWRGAPLQTVGPAELGCSGGWVQVRSSMVREAERLQLLPWEWQKCQTVNRSTETGSQSCPHAFGQSKSSDQGQGREVEATLCL